MDLEFLRMDINEFFESLEEERYEDAADMVLNLIDALRDILSDLEEEIYG